MKKLLSIVLLLLLCCSFATADDYVRAPAVADKYLQPDGSIQSFSGVVFAPANAARAKIYNQQPFQVAKWLLPDGSIASALPFSGGTGTTCSAAGCGIALADWNSFLFGTNTNTYLCRYVSATGKITCDVAQSTFQAAITGSTVLPDGITATTQAAGSNDTKVATNAYVDTAVAALFSGEISDEQLLCGEKASGTQIKSCGAKTTFNDPGANGPLCRTAANTVGACTNIGDTVKKLAVFSWDGGGVAVTANASTKRCVIIPAASTLTGVFLVGSTSTTSTVALYKDAFSTSALATTAMISGTNAVSLSAAIGVKDTTLTNFTTAINADDQICATVTANNNATWLQLTLYGKQ